MLFSKTEFSVLIIDQNRSRQTEGTEAACPGVTHCIQNVMYLAYRFYISLLNHPSNELHDLRHLFAYYNKCHQSLFEN